MDIENLFTREENQNIIVAIPDDFKTYTKSEYFANKANILNETKEKWSKCKEATI